jgi:capsular polysaccharide biosynthesis protein
MTNSAQLRTGNADKLHGQQEDTVEIDLAELLIRLLDRWYWIVLAAVIGTAILGIYTFRFVTPLYQSTSKLYVVNSKNSAINLSDLQIGNYLAKDYQEVFTNWHVHERVIEELQLPYTYTELNNMVKVNNPSDTRILYITVTSPNAQEAMTMANMYAKVACEFVAVKMDQEQPNVFEEARLAAAPSSPNKTRNLLLGFVLGAVVAIAVIVIRFITDDRVRTPEEIEKILGLPTLGVVTEQENFRHGSAKTARSNRE